jgi:hypothetical protein
MHGWNFEILVLCLQDFVHNADLNPGGDDVSVAPGGAAVP